MSSDRFPMGREAWFRTAGVDFHVLRTLVFRGWSLLAGGVTALMIPHFLKATEQGYYFTFAAVLASQIFFELGLNHVLTQLAGHCVANLHRNERGVLEGDIENKRKIASLLTLSRNWNGMMAVLFLGGLLGSGTWFFKSKGTLPTSDWIAPWVTLVIATAANLAMSARLAICEGIGEVGQVALQRLKQSVVGYFVLWLLLVSGAGLWAASAVPSVTAAFTAFWLLRHHPFKTLLAEIPPAERHGISWGRDVFPLQWRIAISWASGYFIFSFLTPTIFANQGPVQAGQVGLALTIFSAISVIGISWVSAKVPDFVALIARHERTALNELFRHQAHRSIVATGLFAMSIVALIALARPFVPALAARLPDTITLAMLGLATMANSTVFAMAAYVRAHKEEPLVAQSVATAAAVILGAYLLSPISVAAAVAAYAGVILFISLPWSFAVFKRYYEKSE